MFQPGTGPPMQVPAVDVSAAWAAVAALRAAAAVAQASEQWLSESADGGAAEWSGRAADSYRHTRATLARRIDDLVVTCTAMSTAVTAWADVAGPAVAQIKETVVAGDAAMARQRAAQAAGIFTDPSIDSGVDDAWTRYEQVGYGYLETCQATADRLDGIRDLIPDRPWDLRDQISGFVGTAWQGGVEQPTESAWELTGEAFVDPRRWWSTVTSVPVSLWNGLTGIFRHPVRTFLDVIDFDAWREGHVGEGVAVAGTLFVGRGKFVDLPKPEKLARFARNMADPRAPKPRLQNVEELLDATDLERNEHFFYGHTIRRHVDVDDDYLKDRLVNGTLLDKGFRGEAPGRASAWSDLDTANIWITRTLRRNEAEIRDWASQPDNHQGLKLELSADQPVGRVMSQRGARFRIDDARRIVVWLDRKPEGIYIYSAYLR